MTAKIAGELEKSNILLAHGIENADGRLPGAGEAHNHAPGAAELPLKRLNAFRRRVKVLLEEVFENFHEGRQNCLRCFDKDSDAGKRMQGALLADRSYSA